MDKIKALEIVSRYMPNMALSTALTLVNELDSQGSSTFQPATPQTRTEAIWWARDNFSQSDRENRKIQCIKTLRNKFNLGLRESKDIMDAHTSNTYQNYDFN